MLFSLSQISHRPASTDPLQTGDGLRHAVDRHLGQAGHPDTSGVLPNIDHALLPLLAREQVKKLFLVDLRSPARRRVSGVNWVLTMPKRKTAWLDLSKVSVSIFRCQMTSGTVQH